jgi:hypothetical protein
MNEPTTPTNAATTNPATALAALLKGGMGVKRATSAEAVYRTANSGHLRIFELSDGTAVGLTYPSDSGNVHLLIKKDGTATSSMNGKTIQLSGISKKEGLAIRQHILGALKNNRISKNDYKTLMHDANGAMMPQGVAEAMEELRYEPSHNDVAVVQDRDTIYINVERDEMSYSVRIIGEKLHYATRNPINGATKFVNDKFTNADIEGIRKALAGTNRASMTSIELEAIGQIIVDILDRP